MTASPFKFLDSYEREDIASFFGRERETAELFRQCFVSPILVVYGGSGTGKTSLVQCGLASRFQESDWLPLPVRRSGDMLASLQEAIRAQTLTESHATSLNEQVANLYLDHFKPIWFLFDQFEELFIFGTHAECEAFFAAVGSLLEAQRNARAIFIVREEYLAELTRYERIISGLIENRYRVERLSHRHAMDVVEKLCSANNIACGEGFSAAMVERLDPEGHGVELSYLQVFLDRCWRTRQDDEPFSTALLERIGHVDDLLGAFLDEQVADTPDPQRSEGLLKTFVSDQGTKRQLTSTEAHDWVNTIGTLMDEAEVELLLQVFVAKRLLKDRDERGRYELLHDALARQIFQRITRAEQELIEVRQFVQQAHGQFQKRGVKLTANDLTYLRPYRNQLHLKGEMRGFVEGAFGEEERKENRKKLRLRAVLGALLILCLIGGKIIADTQKRFLSERAKSQSASLAQLAMEQVDVDPHTAYFLAERAYKLDSSLAAGRAVLRSYNSLYPLMGAYSGSIARVSSNRRNYIIINPESGFTVYDRNGQELFRRVLSMHQPVGVQFICDGSHVLSIDSTITIYDLKGAQVFACRTDDWLAYNGTDKFVAATKDSILLWQSDSLRLIAWKTNTTLWMPWGLKNIYSNSHIGFLDSSLIYMVSKDSARFISILREPSQLLAINVPERHPDKGSNAAAINGALMIHTGYGTHRFDLLMRKWVEVNARDFWPTLFHRDLITTQRATTPAIGSNGVPKPYVEVRTPEDVFKAETRIPGSFLKYFESTRTILVTNSDQDRKVTRLYNIKGDLIRSVDAFTAVFDDRAFITVNDSTELIDRLILWSSDGQKKFEVAARRLSSRNPSPHNSIALEHIGDTTIIMYITDAVINGTKVRELRVMRDSVLTTYATMPGDFDFTLRSIGYCLSGNGLILNRGSAGQSAIGELTKTVRLPIMAGLRGQYWAGQSVLPSGYALFGGYKRHFEQLGDSSSFRVSWRYSVWRPEQFIEDSLIVIGKAWLNNSFMYEGSRFSPGGSFIRIRHLPQDSRGRRAQDSSSVWQSSNGELVTSDLVRGVREVQWSTSDTSTILLLRNDSVLVTDSKLREVLLSVPTDSARLCMGEGLLPALWNRKNMWVRVLDPAEHTSKVMYFDSTEMDPRLDLSLRSWPDGTSLFAENDSTVYLLLNYAAGGGVLQRFVRGRATGMKALPGNCTPVRVHGRLYLRHYATTAKDGDYGIQQERGNKPSYFLVDGSNNQLTLDPVDMAVVEGPEKRFNIIGGGIRLWTDDLFKPDQARFENANLTGQALTKHRLLDQYEVFPIDPSRAIEMVRVQKVYGEFWNHINAEPLIKKVLGTDTYNAGYSIGSILRSTWVKLLLLLGAGALAYWWWQRRAARHSV